MVNRAYKPILALTMGDPVGVGPEIMVKALADAAVHQVCRPLVLGDPAALTRARNALAPEMNMNLVATPEEGAYRPGILDLLALSDLKDADLVFGQPTAAGGAAMVSCILNAIDLAMNNKVAGMVTGPISKTSLKMAGYAYPGHTELLKDKTGAAEAATKEVANKL